MMTTLALVDDKMMILLTLAELNNYDITYFS